MSLTIRELYEMLQDMDANGLLDDGDGEVTVVYQPHYPLAAAARGCGFIARDGQIELVIGASEESNYANSLQERAFTAVGEELVEDEEEDDWGN